jgi:hypothetical protein
MKPLKLKKVKISKIGNPHILFGGILPVQNANNYPFHPVTYTLDTLLDDTCQPGTNDGRTGRTGIASVKLPNSGIQN